jgi:hypothetical protein
MIFLNQTYIIIEVRRSYKYPVLETCQAVEIQYTMRRCEDRVGDQEAKYEYVESWPNTTSVWDGWSRFDTPVDRYGGVHSLLQYTGVSYLPLGQPAGKYLLKQILKSRQGQHFVYSVVGVVSR